jgi:CBS-domain-containing membrane protein
MQVKQIMTRDVKTVRPGDNLDHAARILWENDCGCVPVLDDASRVTGMLTDRDICMAAYFQGRPLRDIQVASAMAGTVFSAKLEDTLVAAEKVMQAQRVRRLPVVDAAGKLTGLLSLNDLAREAARERATRGRKELSDAEVSETLAAICEPRKAAEKAKIVTAA